MDVLNSGVALAVNNLVKEKNAIMINTGAATSDLTNAQCSPNTIHWVYDTYMLANSTGQALVKAGGDSTENSPVEQSVRAGRMASDIAPTSGPPVGM